MIFYFTGTGNSRWCAELLADKLDDDIIDSRPFIKGGIAAELVSDRPWVFVAPVYAWQMAHIFEDFIRAGNFDGSRDAYFVLTAGDSMGAAPERLKKLCDEKGLRYRGTVCIAMPENYIAMFDVPGEERCARMLENARRKLGRRIGFIAAGSDFPGDKPKLMGRVLSGPVNKGFYGYAVGAKKFRTTDKCTLCGACEKLCPYNNISVADGKVTWGDKCTHCMACICYCPHEAIEYGKKSVGKRRYKCEEYKKD